MPGFVSTNEHLSAMAIVGAVAALGFFLSMARYRRSGFTVVDAAIVILVMAIATATAISVTEAISERTTHAALVENLRRLRAGIEQYRIEHGGKVPVWYEGDLPQLTAPTNRWGVPGPRGRDFPYGPYFRGTLPPNPFTGSVHVEPTDEFPPASASGHGGWLYHEPSGQLAPDLEGYLDH